MFKLCKNTAYSRNLERSKKVVTFKVSPNEQQAIKDMMEYYNEEYTSNIIRIALERLYKDMLTNKKSD